MYLDARHVGTIGNIGDVVTAPERSIIALIVDLPTYVHGLALRHK